MKVITAISVCLISLVLGGCAASMPVVQGDSSADIKRVTFPKKGEKVHSLVGGMIHLKAEYSSRHVFKLTKPFTLSKYGGKIIMPADAVLFQATVDGENAYCSDRKVFYDILNRPAQIICFKSPRDGLFTHLMVRADAIWWSSELEEFVEYKSIEIPTRHGVNPLKRELIFEGAQNGNLFFSQKIYEQSLESPSRIKPLTMKVESVPSNIVLDGLELNVTAYTNNSLTYSIVKPWD